MCLAHDFGFALSFRVIVVEKIVCIYLTTTYYHELEPRNDLFRTVCLVHDFDFASSFPVIVVDKIACKRKCASRELSV